MFPQAKTLFYMGNGNPYQQAYFSTIVSDLLTLDGVRTTANHWRHEFATMWRHFLATPTTKLVEFAVEQMEGEAAQLMLNSRDAWNSTYDDTDFDRSCLHCMAMWPQFEEFVKKKHDAWVSKEALSPLAMAFDQLVL
jgi:hypothetical protein